MNKRQEELMRELEYSEFGDVKLPEKDRIREMVNRSLDSVPQERTRRIKQKRAKVAAIVMAAIVLTTSTVWAAVNFDLVNLFFSGDMSPMEQYVETPLDSVTDGRYTLTLEKVLGFQNRILLVYSIEGVTKETQAELMDESFDAKVTIKQSEGTGIRASSTHQEEVKELRTNTKRYYSYIIEGLYNPRETAISFSLDIMEDDESCYIKIPMADEIEILEVTLNTESGSDIILWLSPMDLSVEMEAAEGTEMTIRQDIYFRMEDGALKSSNELFLWEGSVYAGDDPHDEDTPRYKHTAKARDIAVPSAFKSVIIENIEYDLNDPTKRKEIELPERFRPFSQNAVLYDRHFMLPVKEVIEKLGGEITIDETGENAVIQLRGSTFEIGMGKNYYLRDGVRFAYEREPAIGVANGTLVMETLSFEICFKVGVDIKRLEPLENTEWLITP